MIKIGIKKEGLPRNKERDKGPIVTEQAQHLLLEDNLLIHDCLTKDEGVQSWWVPKGR